MALKRRLKTLIRLKKYTFYRDILLSAVLFVSFIWDVLLVVKLVPNSSFILSTSVTQILVLLSYYLASKCHFPMEYLKLVIEQLAVKSIPLLSFYVGSLV